MNRNESVNLSSLSFFSVSRAFHWFYFIDFHLADLDDPYGGLSKQKSTDSAEGRRTPTAQSSGKKTWLTARVTLNWFPVVLRTVPCKRLKYAFLWCWADRIMLQVMNRPLTHSDRQKRFTAQLWHLIRKMLMAYLWNILSVCRSMSMSFMNKSRFIFSYWHVSCSISWRNGNMRHSVNVRLRLLTTKKNGI